MKCSDESFERKVYCERYRQHLFNQQIDFQKQKTIFSPMINVIQPDLLHFQAYVTKHWSTNLLSNFPLHFLTCSN